MASTSLSFDIFGRDRTASKALKGVGDTAHRTQGRLSKFGAVAGSAFAGIGTAAVAAGAVIAVDFGKQSIQAFMDAEAQQAKFDDAMSRFPGLAAYKSGIEDLAESLALKTKYDDDATKSSAALLAQFGLTGKQLTNLIPLVQDYATATGKDLGTASKDIGLALLGNKKALKSLGIDGFKPTGDRAKDLAVLMDLLRGKVGGLAEKEGKTAAGTMAILGNQFDEVKEDVGAALIPALTKLGRWFIDVGIPKMREFAGWIGDNVVPVVTALWQNFQQNFLPVIGKVWSFIGGTLIPGIQRLAAAFMENVWPALQQVAAMVAENLQPAVEELSKFWTGTLQPALAVFWQFFQTKLLPILQKWWTFLGLVVAAIAVVVSWIVGKLIPAAVAMVRPWITFYTKVAEVVGKVIGKVGEIVQWFREAPGKIASAASGMWNGIVVAFRSAVNSIIRIWNNLRLTWPSFDGDWNGPLPGGEFSVGGWTIDTPNIPYLAKGGIVTRPTLAMIGEAGPEAVVPLSRGAGYGGTAVNINVTRPLGTPAEIGQAVYGALQDYSRQTGVALRFS